MDFLKDMSSVKSIHTKGLMKGDWNRMKSNDSSKTIFQSHTHPNFSLTFIRAFLVMVGVDNENHSFFWDPNSKNLFPMSPVKIDNNLTVEVTAPKVSGKSVIESFRESSFLEQEKGFRAKIDDLTKQVESLQLICVTQERNLRILARDAEKKQPEKKQGDKKNVKVKFKKKPKSNKDLPGEKPPFEFLNIPDSEKAPTREPLQVVQPQRACGVSGALYDPSRMHDLWGGPQLPHGASHYSADRLYDGYSSYDPYRPPFQLPYEEQYLRQGFEYAGQFQSGPSIQGHGSYNDSTFHQLHQKQNYGSHVRSPKQFGHQDYRHVNKNIVCGPASLQQRQCVSSFSKKPFEKPALRQQLVEENANYKSHGEHKYYREEPLRAPSSAVPKRNFYSATKQQPCANGIPSANLMHGDAKEEHMANVFDPQNYVKDVALPSIIEEGALS